MKRKGLVGIIGVEGGSWVDRDLSKIAVPVKWGDWSGIENLFLIDRLRFW